MNDRVRHLFNEARKLTEAEQVELAEMLLTSDPPLNLDAEWIAEAEQRWSRHEQSGGKTYEAFATIDEIRGMLAKRRSK